MNSQAAKFQTMLVWLVAIGYAVASFLLWIERANGSEEPLPVEISEPLPIVAQVPPPSPPVSVSIATYDAVEALQEVNALRARRGLRPFLPSNGLMRGAMACASARAAARLFGHTPSDFAYLPLGVTADAAGCAAYPPELGWLSCCTNENYTYGGAAWAMGADGKRYMHLFVSNTGDTAVGIELVPVAGQFQSVACQSGVCTSGQAVVSQSSYRSEVQSYTIRTSGGFVREFRPIRGLFSRIRDRIGSRLDARAGCG